MAISLPTEKEPFVMPFALMSIASNPFRYRRASNFERGFLVLAPIPRGPPRLQTCRKPGWWEPQWWRSAGPWQ
jgi:hypothetical protein